MINRQIKTFLKILVKKIHQGVPRGAISNLKEIHFQEFFSVNFVRNDARILELSITESAKKKLVKTDILSPRYKQFSAGGVYNFFFEKYIFLIFELLHDISFFAGSLRRKNGTFLKK